MITSELMGPGFFIFFQTETEIPEERPAGGYFDYGTTPERRRFVPKTKPEEKAAPIVNRIAEKILETRKIETNQDIELILRLKLEQEHIRFKQLYLTYLIGQAKIERKAKQRKAAVILLLH